MLHEIRVWSVTTVQSPEHLAQMLTEFTWCCCNAFRLQGYIFANDATSADGAQEYAVLRTAAEASELVQIESITFSWCSPEKAMELIQSVVAGRYDAECYDRITATRFETPGEHGVCGHCA